MRSSTKLSNNQQVNWTRQDGGSKQFDNVTWADFGTVGDELTVCDHDVKSLRYKDLQAVCSQLKIWGIKNAAKEQMIKKLAFMHQVKTRHGKTSEVLESTLTRNEPQCPFRLHNILFSDWFGEGFSQLGNVASRSELDTGKAANNQLFWEVVQEAFHSADPVIDNLHFDDDDILQELHYIDFTKIVPHDWNKLCSIWKQVNRHYKECLGCFTTSGTHSSNFFDFFEGHLETYYLQWHLDARPDLCSSSTKHKKDKDSEIATQSMIWKQVGRIQNWTRKSWQYCRSRKSAGMLNSSFNSKIMS